MNRLISSGEEKIMDARSPIMSALTIAGASFSGPSSLESVLKVGDRALHAGHPAHLCLTGSSLGQILGRLVTCLLEKRDDALACPFVRHARESHMIARHELPRIFQAPIQRLFVQVTSDDFIASE
jgi:hypothetical protein